MEHLKTVAGLACFSMLFSCNKEAADEPVGVSKNTNDLENVEARYLEEFLPMYEDEKVAAILMHRYKLDALSKGKTNTTGDQEIGEFFILTEGLLNFDFADEWNTDSKLVNHASTIEVPVYQDGEVVRVSNEDLMVTYKKLYDQIDLYVDESKKEKFVVSDLTMESLQGNTLTIGVNIVKTSFSLNPYIPLYPAWGAELAGWCHDYDPGTGFDAATFIGEYANGTAPWRSQVACPLEDVACVSTYNMPSWFDPLPFIAYVNSNTPYDYYQDYAPLFWQSAINQCLGYDIPEWTALHNKIDDVIYTFQLPFVQSLGSVPPTNNPREFYMVQYHSHDSSDPGPGYITENYWHGGDFLYGAIVCVP